MSEIFEMIAAFLDTSVMRPTTRGLLVYILFRGAFLLFWGFILFSALGTALWVLSIPFRPFMWVLNRRYAERTATVKAAYELKRLALLEEMNTARSPALWTDANRRYEEHKLTRSAPR